MMVIDTYSNPQVREDVGNMFETNPNLLVLYGALCPVRYQREVRLYAYPSESPTYWFLLNKQKGWTPMVIAAQQGDSYDAATFLLALKLFFDETHLLKNDIEIEFGAESHMMHEIAKYLVETTNLQAGLRREHYVFYMTPDQMQNAQKVECGVPYGYEISDLTTDDAEKIHAASESKEPLETFRKRIVSLPSSCIRQTSSSRVISHELRSHCGAMVDQYTVPEHRRQGLGQTVEMILAQKIMSLNEVPFKLVPSYLTSFIYSSQESPFWTLWSRNSFPVPYVIQKFGKST
uniref:Glycine N-acyltransferase-like protein n=1 Tax=Haemonchus contortus TaxID=6289 RepID=A0A7I5E5P4_HAECO|nr:Hypothetical protein CBG07665 [Haemonchus contortus]